MFFLQENAMTITAHIGETKDGAPCVELREDGKIIAKVYTNKQQTKIRIVLPELRNFRQTLIAVDSRLVEFDRDPRGGLVK